MYYRQLGSTGIQVSAIGFGCYGIGGGYRRKDPAEAKRAVERALDVGINYFDSAPFVYGDSEKIVGAVVGSRRNSVILASKVEEFDRFSNPVRECVEQSLRSYGTDYLDILQFRDPSAGKVQRFRFLEEAEALKSEGKIRFAAVTIGDTHQTTEGRYALDAGFPVIQLAYNLIFSQAEEDLLDAAHTAGCGIVARGPLCKGFLAARLNDIPADIGADPNFRWFTPEEGSNLLKIQSALGFLARDGRSLAQAAIQFVLRHPAIATTIPSLETEADVDELAGALAVPALSEEEIQRARAAVSGFPSIDY
ncbi:MAG: aldo/keto reductase [Terrimicrobiaceae bacterium]|nr:aldo/keto reductase [Terrimicrobiaceae bacterium]